MANAARGANRLIIVAKASFLLEKNSQRLFNINSSTYFAVNQNTCTAFASTLT
jgi:hypothetical protein